MASSNAETTVPGLATQHTTYRGMAAASFTLGMWASVVFWWYPFGMLIGIMATIFGSISIALGVKGGREGTNLALYGTLLGGNAVGMALIAYRFMQAAYEGMIPTILP